MHMFLHAPLVKFPSHSWRYSLLIPLKVSNLIHCSDTYTYNLSMLHGCLRFFSKDMKGIVVVTNWIANADADIYTTDILADWVNVLKQWCALYYVYTCGLHRSNHFRNVDPTASFFLQDQRGCQWSCRLHFILLVVKYSSFVFIDVWHMISWLALFDLPRLVGHWDLLSLQPWIVNMSRLTRRI